ncbi:hypothetical protein [Kribbella sp. NPDC048915]|uniref:hypothetical protein n=1 Tax=Kribbella sp. NPDC048915 TaxID=3155148 RepID=UPI0034084484
MDADQRVPRDSFAYQEVARLYGLARSLRPTAADRWNGALYATNSDNLGGLHPETGDLRLSERRVLRYLTGSRAQAHADDQAEALATVLYQATHAAMHVMAPNEPNAVWTEHSRGLMVGFAEVRTFADFDAFADRAGYGAPPLGDPQYAGAFTATRDLMNHITGPAYLKHALINDACRGPALMHFDKFAKAIVENRLSELVRRDETEQRAIRATLIGSMLHDHWPTLHSAPAATGHRVAHEIRSNLDAKIDEIRRHYRLPGPRPAHDHSGTSRDREPTRPAPTARQDTLDGLRFLAQQAPPAGAVARNPKLGQGSRRPNTSLDRLIRPSHSSPARD